MVAENKAPRLTSFAAGGGCACKIPPGELERTLAGIIPPAQPGVLVGLETGDDAAAVRDAHGQAILATTDFFTPVVDDPRTWGKIAATNAFSDIYAMGGNPVVALNLVAWPREKLPLEVLAEVLAGGAAIAEEAGCPLLGGHSIDAPEPTYGLAVTGVGDPEKLFRNDAARPGLPLTLTKPLGVGVLNNRHKRTGEVFDQAIASMTTLNRDAAAACHRAGVQAVTDVTGFGLLGHLHKMLRASGCAAVLDAAAIPVLEGVRESLAEGFIPGGSRRNLDWVRAELGENFRPSSRLSEEELVLFADAQTSGGLLVAGEVPGYPVIGELVPGAGITLR